MPAAAAPPEAVKPGGREVPKPQPMRLLVCGGDEAFLAEWVEATRPAGSAAPKAEAPVRTWRWKARDRDDVPQRYRGMFGTIAECKPLGDGNLLLITAKEGGIAVYDRKKDRTIFTATMPGRAYSGDLLPRNRLAVVGGKDEAGCIMIYDLENPEVAICRDALVLGHSAYWDSQAQTLWVITFTELRSYKLADWEARRPSLQLVQSHNLPAKDGHDLEPNPGTSEFIITVGNSVWLFNSETKKFRPHPILGAQQHIKSVAVHPVTGLFAYVQPDGDNWWTNNVKFLGSKETMVFPSNKVYKARWLLTDK